MVRTSICAVGAGILMFAGVAFLPRPRALAQKGPMPTPTPSPVIIYSEAASQIHDPEIVTAGWTYTVDYPTGVDSDNTSYWLDSCEGTSADSNAKYNAALNLNMTNSSGASGTGDYSFMPHITGTCFSTGHTATANVTVADYTFTDTTNLINYDFNKDDDANVNFQWNLPNNGTYTWSDFFTLSGSAS